ncbi:MULTISPECIES: DotU family type IV/VI secretion system protein [Oleiagrimonas]|uniref:DotU family type IV/VI secretion system protein n=1 Tax=Oleiagrimonas citrea TaxID=1665687 RepID=A0A846ZQH9_9GAMM|nr:MULTISPECIES: DotU family type IV/VI secretion system protein [Oleiagrimonas]NKZ40182.1 DotU family type IV/VI secretion system protein [Oleiagrimonas citrea]
MRRSDRNFLLEHFSAFYEELARIKQAARSQELTRLLEPDTPHAEIDPHVMAERVAARLLAVMDAQMHEVRGTATGAEMDAYRRTRYVMAALADEICIFDLSRPGTNDWTAHWTEHLIEYSIARSRIAGRQFFALAKALVECRAPSVLEANLAAVFLLALQLGFQGMYRGPEGRNVLRAYRSRLYKLARLGDIGKQREHAFPQAYDYAVQVDESSVQIRPALSPWLRAAAYVTVGYLLVSSAIWLTLTWSVVNTLGGAP